MGGGGSKGQGRGGRRGQAGAGWQLVGLKWLPPARGAHWASRALRLRASHQPALSSDSKGKRWSLEAQASSLGRPSSPGRWCCGGPPGPFRGGRWALLLVYPGRPTLGSGAPSPAQASPSTPARALDCCSSQQAWTTWSTVAGRVVSAFSELKDVLRWATCTTSLHCHDPALLPTGLEHPRGSLAEPLCGLTASAVWAGRVHARDRGRWSRCGVEQTLPA